MIEKYTHFAHYLFAELSNLGIERFRISVNGYRKAQSRNDWKLCWDVWLEVPQHDRRLALGTLQKVKDQLYWNELEVMIDWLPFWSCRFRPQQIVVKFEYRPAKLAVPPRNVYDSGRR